MEQEEYGVPYAKEPERQVMNVIANKAMNVVIVVAKGL
jgi:hypothetical protein